MVGVITVPFQNDLGVPQLRSRVGLFASIAALRKVQRISASIPHAHCGALEIICAIARILRAISTFASGKHLKDAGGIFRTHSLEASEGGLESSTFVLVKIIFYAPFRVRGCSGKPTVELHSGTRTCSVKPGALPSGYAQNPLF